jgi:hypothetical protein
MTIIQKNDGELIITEKVPAGLRIFLSVLGLIAMTLAPYELLVRPKWNGFSAYLIIPVVISIGAIIVGGTFIAAGAFGVNQTLIVSVKTKSIQYYYESVFLPLRRKTYHFSEISGLEITTHDWTDGPSTYGLRVNISGGQKISIGSFKTKSDAGQYVTIIGQLMQ